MKRCRINLPNRCYHLISRVAHRAFEFEGLQAANRKGRAAMTRKTYCGNLLWQSGLTLKPPDNSIEINYYYVTKSSVRGTLLHELQHRLDWCKLGPTVDCSDRAEREVRAVLRSGRCAKFYDGKTLIDWDCVKKTAKQSTERHKECRSIAENVVNQAVERVTGGNL